MPRVLDRLASALAAPSDVRELDLSGAPGDQLDTVPTTIAKLVNLEILRLDRNALVGLPEALSKLRKLRELHAAYNQITSEGIHRSVWFIKTLEVLNLHGNRLAWIDNLGNYQKSPLALYLGGNPLDVTAYQRAGQPIHPLWHHVLHMFPLTRTGKPKVKTLALDASRIAFPLPGAQLHHEPPFSHVELLQLYGTLTEAQRAALAAQFPVARIELHANADEGPHLPGASTLAPVPSVPPPARSRPWHPEQLAHQTKVLAAAKRKKQPLDERALRPCIAIATRPASKKRVTGASRIGGLPDLPPALAWPARDGEPMLFVAQLRLEDLAPYDPEALLPPRGVLSFFVAGWEDPHVVHLEDTADLDERKPPSAMRFADLAYEPLAAGTLELHGEVSAPNNDAGSLLPRTANRTRRVHRVLGHDFGDTEMFDEDSVLLLAVGSDDDLALNWGDAGTIYFTIARDALARRDFTRVELLHTM